MAGKSERFKFFICFILPIIIIVLKIISVYGYDHYLNFYYNSLKNTFISETNVIEKTTLTIITTFMDTKIETHKNLIYYAAQLFVHNEINIGLTRFPGKYLFIYDNKFHSVKFLGLNKYWNKNYADLRKQVKIFYYKSYNFYDNEFTIKLLPQNSSNEIIISTISKEDTLYGTYDKIIKQTDTQEIFSYRDICLHIPVVDFFLTQKNNVSFKLNEKDIFFELKNKIIYDYNGIGLVVSRPFFICIKNKNSKLPYFMAYIANDELLVKD